ncbi:hypothetical protein M2263_001516 [Providencia alcalifaciens]|nr:hypothetical protein [Providencia alcalifaciens]
MRVQHLYWPLVAAMAFPALIWFFDWLDRFHFTRVAPHLRNLGHQGIASFIFTKLLHLLFTIVIPAYVLANTGIGVGTLLLTYLLSQMFALLIFVILILGTHWAKATIIEQTAKQFPMNYHCIEAKELFIYQHRFLREMGSGKQAD